MAMQDVDSGQSSLILVYGSMALAKALWSERLIRMMRVAITALTVRTVVAQNRLPVPT